MIRFFKDFPLKYKLIFGFLLIITINGIFGFMNVKIMKELSDLVNLTYDKALMSGTFAQASKFDFSQYDSEIKSALLSSNLEDFKKHKRKSERYINTLRDDLEVVRERALSPRSQGLIDDILKTLEGLEKTQIELILKKEKNLNSFSLELEQGWEDNAKRLMLYKKLTALYDDAAEVGYNNRLSSEEKNTKTLSRTVSILIFCSITGLLLSVGVSYIIIVPMLKLQNVIKRVGEGDYSVRSTNKSKDELGNLSSAFNFMLDTIEEKNENISSLLSSLPFALFYFDKTGRISKERSQSTDLIFKDFSKFNTLLDFYDHHGLKNNKIQKIIDATFMGLIPFDSAVFLFPDSIETRHNDEVKTINLSFKPSYDAKGNLEKVILIGEDVTEKNKAIAESKELTERVERVSKVSADIAGFKEFMISSKDLFVLCSSQIQNYRPDQDEELKRNLHSLKGLLGIYSFNSCVEQIHELENILQVDPETKIQEALALFKVIFSVFTSQSQDIIKLLALNTEGNIKFYNITKIKKLEEAVAAIKNESIAMVMEEIDKFPIEQVFTKYKSHAQSVAEKLVDKKVNLVYQKSSEVSYEEIQRLDPVLVHILNNSIDHGIESTDARTQVSKSEYGSISIVCTRLPDQSLELVISDDGKGINGDSVLNKALMMGLINEKEAEVFTEADKVNLIFLSGLSTKDEASEISGRGVGMDAVKNYVESLGGSIQLLSQVGRGTTFTLKIPAL